MADFFIRNNDEQLAENATHLDDVDLIPSKVSVGPWGPSLVAVAVKHGIHVCWRCGEGFNQNKPNLQETEVAMGGARVLLHSMCVNGSTRSFRSFADITRGLQARRFFANATKKVESLIEKVTKANE